MGTVSAQATIRTNEPEAWRNPEAEAMRMVAKFREQNALMDTCQTLGSLRKQHSGNAQMVGSLTAAIDHTLRLYDLATNDFKTLLEANRDDAYIMALVNTKLLER